MIAKIALHFCCQENPRVGVRSSPQQDFGFIPVERAVQVLGTEKHSGPAKGAWHQTEPHGVRMPHSRRNAHLHAASDY